MSIYEREISQKEKKKLHILLFEESEVGLKNCACVHVHVHSVTVHVDTVHVGA